MAFSGHLAYYHNFLLVPNMAGVYWIFIFGNITSIDESEVVDFFKKKQNAKSFSLIHAMDDSNCVRYTYTSFDLHRVKLRFSMPNWFAYEIFLENGLYERNTKPWI